MTSSQSTSMSAELIERIQKMCDRQDIQDCLTRFSRGVDRFDREVFLSAFHVDAEISAGSFVGGPEPLYDWASKMHEQGQVATQHLLLNHSCDIKANIAHTETYYLFVGRNKDDSNWIAGGRYIDRFERRSGTWKIAFRTNVIEWSGVVPTMEIPFGDVTDLIMNGLASRNQNDPSYHRPLINRREFNIPKD